MTRVLFACSRGDDYTASCLFDGLCEVLGEQNVIDAAPKPTSMLHNYCNKAGLSPCANVGATRRGVTLAEFDTTMSFTGQDFDVLVIVAKFNEDYPWPWIEGLRTRLRDGGKIVYVEGWDSAEQCDEPRTQVDACFRREMLPGVRYPLPHTPGHLPFSAPSRWFVTEEVPRDIDVFFAGAGETTHRVRWDMLGRVFETRTRHRSVICSMGLGMPEYWQTMRRAKLALIPPGGGDCSDTLRQWEAMACGAVPVFVGHPARHQEQWFPVVQAPHRDSGTVFTCRTDTLVDTIDFALSCDLETIRRNMQAFARAHHTTAARARKVLASVGVTI